MVKGVVATMDIMVFINHHFYFRAQLEGSFTLCDLLDKPWSQVSSFLPQYVPSVLSRVGFSIPTARRFSSTAANSRPRVSADHCSATKFSYEYVHSVRIEPTKLILVGTRITYRASDFGMPPRKYLPRKVYRCSSISMQ